MWEVITVTDAEIKSLPVEVVLLQPTLKALPIIHGMSIGYIARKTQ
jgi:hypothetical protein